MISRSTLVNFAKFHQNRCVEDEENQTQTESSIFKNFLSDPFVGSFCESSKMVAQRIAKYVEIYEPETIIEYGAGNGAITREILKSIKKDAQLYAIETNQNLFRGLKNSLTDERLTLIHGNAVDARFLIPKKAKTSGVDLIVSGIPFRFFSKERCFNILRNSAWMLKPEGIFLSYQTWIPPFITSRGFNKLLSPYFTNIKSENILLNFPPLQVFVSQPRAFRTKERGVANEDVITRDNSTFELSSFKRRHKLCAPTNSMRLL